MKQFLCKYFIIISIALFSHFLSYSFWEQTIGPRILWLFSTFIFIGFIIKYKKFLKQKDANHAIVMCLVCLPIISALLNLLIKGYSINNFRTNFLISIASMAYIIICDLRITERRIINSLTIIGLITLFLQIIQQFVPSFVLFGLIGDSEFGEGYAQRNSIFRFYIGSYFVSVICMYYYWTNLILKKFRLINLALFVCFCSSMYLYVTRQLMLASALTFLISIFFIKSRKIRIRCFWLIIIILTIILYNYDSLFGNLVDSYTSDTYTTDIRIKAISFFIEKIIDNPLGLFVGNGHTTEELRWASKGFYLSDIGFIGEWYLYGIIWIVVYFVTLYKYVIKHGNTIPLYIRLYFIGTFICSIMIFPYRNSIETAIWIYVLYIAGQYVANSKINIYN